MANVVTRDGLNRLTARDDQILDMDHMMVHFLFLSLRVKRS